MFKECKSIILYEVIHLLPDRFKPMRLAITGFLIIFCLTSCFTIKPLEYNKAENIITSVTGTDFNMAFDLSMHNPNNWSVKLTEVETEVTIDNILLGKANLAEHVRLKRNSDFKLPMKAISSTNDLSKFAALGLNLLLGNQQATATVKGTMTLKKFIFRKKYQFEYKEKIDSRILQSFF